MVQRVDRGYQDVQDIPNGGAAGDVLTKNSSANGDCSFAAPAGGGPKIALLNFNTDGTLLYGLHVTACVRSGVGDYQCTFEPGYFVAPGGGKGIMVLATQAGQNTAKMFQASTTDETGANFKTRLCADSTLSDASYYVAFIQAP